MKKYAGSDFWTRQLGVLLVCVLLVTPACGGDGGANPADPDLPDPTDLALTQAEATAMVAALLLAFTPAPSIPSPELVQPGPWLVPTTTIVVDSSTTTVPCPSGGTVAVMNRDSTLITVDARINPTPDTTFAANSTWSGKARLDAQYLSCGVPDNSGSTWTFDANPALVFDLNLNGTINSAGLTNGSSLTSITSNWDGLWSGQLNWSNGGRTGSCPFSIAMVSTSATSNGQSSFSFTQNGQMCGFNVSHSSSG